MTAPAYWAVVPAAGVGRRMATTTPKQFLALGGQTVLEHTLDSLWSTLDIKGLVLVGKANPVLASIQLRFGAHCLMRAEGGQQRCHSVLNGLNTLLEYAQPDDWVLVHDAARPCVRQQDLKQLCTQLAGHSIGGLLGAPARDTMKRADSNGSVEATVQRTGLWHAFTPQMFRFGLLHAALKQALSAGIEVTDEASAMEHAGYQPLMVEGHADNIKITRPEDLPLAEYFLIQQGRL
ncbi:2-C-methyl-D-erythritol 4-phosphate cytidylyltransferase [hydrothermal vent metagenome]|uniref:2-C-methyl-D-erythritol 4-phosphate cytidylyltransferase n=1 Tax=hydrothermal vent metagenome TaxID=652676 RepID=A0A3B0YW71_9ZZZZ